MKIVIAGGSGQVGACLARAFKAGGCDVVILSRGDQIPPAGRLVKWDGRSLGPWAAEIDGADAVVNLAGRSINCRHNPVNRRQIVSSRTESTRAVGEAIGRAARPPRVWLQAGTATIYAHRLDAPNDEATGILRDAEPGFPDTWTFGIEVARAWEKALDEAVTPGTRRVVLRTGLVMNPDAGSAFDAFLGLVRRGLGGSMGGGRQFVPWIHYEDYVRAAEFLVRREDISGPVNLVAPNPVPNEVFMRELRRAWGMPFGLPSAEWMLEVGAFLMRTETELLLKSRRVVPARLLDAGFGFKFPVWSEAAADLCGQWSRLRGF